jgi:hypothetical protein
MRMCGGTGKGHHSALKQGAKLVMPNDLGLTARALCPWNSGSVGSCSA